MGQGKVIPCPISVDIGHLKLILLPGRWSRPGDVGGCPVIVHFDSLSRDAEYRAVKRDSLYSDATVTLWAEVPL